MFTGIVEELGELVALRHQDGAALATVRGAVVSSDLQHGDSVLVNGVCLTVAEHDPADGTFVADVMRETLERSTLGSLSPGDALNLERAALVGGRLGGHLVQGHVDGVATVLDRRPAERWDDVRIALPPDLHRYVVEKGSITVDGVSLTVVSVHDDAFTVSLIPTTLRDTTLGRRAVGEPVNLEVDVIGKYVERFVNAPERVS